MKFFLTNIARKLDPGMNQFVPFDFCRTGSRVRANVTSEILNVLAAKSMFDEISLVVGLVTMFTWHKKSSTNFFVSR